MTMAAEPLARTVLVVTSGRGADHAVTVPESVPDRRRLVVDGPTHARVAPDLVLVVVAGVDATCRKSLWRAALLARRHRVPLVVQQPDPDVLTHLRRDRVTRLLTSRIVSRTVVSGSSTAMLPPETLIELGLDVMATPTDGTAPLRLDDLDDVVHVHRRAFPDSAMTLLGDRVVERYYRWQFLGPHPTPFARAVRRDGHLVGFVVGGVRHDAVSGFARRFLATVLIGATTHPRGAWRLAGPTVLPVLRLMFRRHVSQPAPEPTLPGVSSPAGPSSAPSFGILSIAVDPNTQGSGAAAELMADAEAAARRGGFDRMHLTVNADNGRAICFYERLGWERDPADGTWGGRMVKRLSATG